MVPWRLTIDDQAACQGSNICHIADPKRRSIHDAAAGCAGTMKPKITPRGTLGLAHNRPLCTSIIDRQIDSPSPQTVRFSWCRKPRNTRSRAAGAKPGPESRTSTATPSDSLRLPDEQLPLLFADVAHGFDGIDDQVKQYLLQLGPGPPRICGKPSASCGPH